MYLKYFQISLAAYFIFEKTAKNIKYAQTFKLLRTLSKP